LLLRRRHELVGQDDDDDLSLESDDDRHYYLTSDEEYQEEEEDETDKEHDISQELNDEENELDEEEKLLYLYESGTESEDENEKGDDKRVQLPAGKAKIQDKIETAHIVNHDDSSDEDYEPVEVILLDETTDKDYDSDDEVSARSSIMKNILLDEVQTNLKSYREYNSLVSSSSSDGEEEQDDEMSHVNTSNHEADTQHQILEFVASPLNGRKPSTRKRRSRKHKMTQSIKRKSSSGDNRNMHEGEEYIRDTSNGGGHAIAKGKWSLGDRIGQGSFGVVHKGMNGRSGKLMAVKCLCIPSNQSSSFQDLVVDLEREIRLMKSFDHKNIVRYIGTEIDTEKHMLYIFQEWVPGGSVASLLKNFGPFPLGVIRTYLYQMVCGLEYLHSKQILHRDIKGGNILVNDEGIVKLADFGASKRIQVSENGTLMDIDDLMENMTFRGTPFFMAPEVFEEKYGPKADIWSCAGVAHQMSTGTPPWKDLGLRSQIPLFNHLKNSSGPPPMPKDDDQNSATPVSCQSFQNLLTQCFQRDPKKRPSTQVLLQHQFFRERDPNESILEDVSEAEYRCFSAEKKNYRHSRLNTPLSPVSPISPLKLLQLKRQEKTPHIPKVAGEISSGDWPSWAKEAAERKR
jgi:serine/threonine protein kinase